MSVELLGYPSRFSPNLRYRYTLWRECNGVLSFATPVDAFLMFIGLNPSTADDVINDHTITKCTQFTRRWGYRRFVMANLFAYRATKPEDMKAAESPVGPDNDFWINVLAHRATKIVCMWGNHGTFQDRDKYVLEMLLKDRELWTFGCNRNGTPMHPLMVPYSCELVPFAA